MADFNLSGGSAMLGGQSPIQQVLAQGGPAMSQQSPASAGFNPAMVPPAPIQGQSGGMPPMGGAPPIPGASTGTPGAGLPPQTPEANLIIQALNDRLKSLSKNGIF
jgi:hypothetical protein